MRRLLAAVSVLLSLGGVAALGLHPGDAGAAGAAATQPDFAVSPEETERRTVKSVLVGSTGRPVFYDAIYYTPQECRHDPKQDLLCDVYRLKLNRDRAADATNFVVLNLEWDDIAVPELQITAGARTEPQQQPNLDMVVWSSSTRHLPYTSGGQGARVPERIAFLATQDEYDIVVQISMGAATEYSLRAFLTNERPQPFVEVLDAALTPAQPSRAAAGVLSPTSSDAAGAHAATPIGVAPVDTDPQIAGVGLGAAEQFDAADLGAHTRAVAATEPPSATVLLLALVVIPGATAAAVSARLYVRTRDGLGRR